MTIHPIYVRRGQSVRDEILYTYAGGGETIYSSEGTIQGDPLAMAMFALAMLPLIDRINDEVRQIWYADDASAGGKMDGL